MQRTRVIFGAPIAPKNAALEKIRAFDRQKNIFDRYLSRSPGQRIATYSAAGRKDNSAPCEFLKNLGKKTLRNSAGSSDVAQEHHCTNRLSCQDEQAIDCVRAFSPEFHLRVRVKGPVESFEGQIVYQRQES